MILDDDEQEARPAPPFEPPPPPLPFEPPPPSPPRSKWTRRVPHPVLIGHAASLSQVSLAGDAHDARGRALSDPHSAALTALLAALARARARPPRRNRPRH